MYVCMYVTFTIIIQELHVGENSENWCDCKIDLMLCMEITSNIWHFCCLAQSTKK